MCNLLVTFVQHPSTSMMFDGGCECTGQAWKPDRRELMGNYKENFNGPGGIHHEIFMTRDAPTECYAQHGDILDKLTEFFGGKPSDNRDALCQRVHPETLCTSQAINTVSGSYTLLKREKRVDGERTLKDVKEKSIESFGARLSTAKNPLRFYVLALGGAAYLGHCFKHNLSLTAGDCAKWTILNIKILMRVLHWVRSPWIWNRLKTHSLRILRASKLQSDSMDSPDQIGLPMQAAEPFDMHLQVGSKSRIIANQTLIKALISGLRKPLEGIVIRWLSIEKGAADLTDILPLLAGATVLAFGEGKPENRCLLAIDLVSGAGLESEYAKFVRFDPKVQRILTPMTTPYFILDLWITRLILEVAWDPMNDASSRLAGASLVHIGGVDSVLRISLYVLRRMLFVAMPFPP